MSEQIQQSRFTFTIDPVTQSAFDRYHQENPQVYAKLRQYALEAKAAGRTHVGINMLHERLRWYTSVETRDDTFKLNNNWRPFYSRLLMQEPELAGLFEVRKAKADEDER